MNKFSIWSDNADIILKDLYDKEKIKELFFCLLKYVDNAKRNGACHETAAILFVLFNEIGLAPKLCMGEVTYEYDYSCITFDHSWVEISGEIYDVAVYLTYDYNSFPPVIRGKNIETFKLMNSSYGVKCEGLGEPAIGISKKYIVDYMDDCPNYMNGLWDIVKIIGNSIELNIDIDSLRDKYKGVKWEII